MSADQSEPPQKTKVKSKKISSSQRAGLIFPVKRTKRIIKANSSINRCSILAGVYLAGVGQYLVKELLDGSYEARVDEHSTKKHENGTDKKSDKKDHKKRILPRHIQAAIETDSDLRQAINPLENAIRLPDTGFNKVLEKDILKAIYYENNPKKKRKSTGTSATRKKQKTEDGAKKTVEKPTEKKPLTKKKVAAKKPPTKKLKSKTSKKMK